MFSFAFGIGTKDTAGNWLEVFYPAPLLAPDDDLLRPVVAALDYDGGNRFFELSAVMISRVIEACEKSGQEAQVTLLSQLAHSERPVVATLIETDDKPDSVPEVYLKLHLLSHRLVKPHGTVLDGMFGVLPNVAWTSAGAIAIGDLDQRRLEARLAGETLRVHSVDKFPKMTDYVVPSGVRIADAARVRLGAYLGEGTTVMHEGFVNFNAGSAGEAMIEGRISAGVFVGTGSDLGGGSSIMGTLSGGGKEVIAVGRNCLIGANAGLGISLGDNCIVEAGLYVTAGTRITLLDSDHKPVEVVKARDLSGGSGLLLRRNSTSGAVECLTNKTQVELNAELHAHN